MNNASSHIDECHILILSWMIHLYLLMYWKKPIYSVGQLFNDYSCTMFLSPNILICSWTIHFFLFMNGSSTQCRKQSIMWEKILMIVHEWCFYLGSWTSTFNPFMNGSFLPFHEWFIIVFDKILMIMHKFPWIWLS